jgi:hypothetical protein
VSQDIDHLVLRRLVRLGDEKVHLRGVVVAGLHLGDAMLAGNECRKRGDGGLDLDPDRHVEHRDDMRRKSMLEGAGRLTIVSDRDEVKRVEQWVQKPLVVSVVEDDLKLSATAWDPE